LFNDRFTVGPVSRERARDPASALIGSAGDALAEGDDRGDPFLQGRTGVPIRQM